MNYQYRIYHSEAGKSPLDTFLYPYTDDRVLSEYRLFPSALANLFVDSSIDASCVPANPETGGVIVTLVSECSREDANSSLERFLTKLNSQIPGLCLLIERL